MNKQRSRVFVVDDDRSVRTSLANLLESDDYTVETFASAAEYLSQTPLLGPSCLVLDVQLPGLDGLALQRQLLEGGRTEQIVFIPGFGDIPMGIQAMKRGAIDFLPKPFDDGALLSAVRQALVAGVVDELTLDIAPVLLGSGERIFDGVESFGMEPVEVLQSPLATHIRYRRLA